MGRKMNATWLSGWKHAAAAKQAKTAPLAPRLGRSGRRDLCAGDKSKYLHNRDDYLLS